MNRKLFLKSQIKKFIPPNTSILIFGGGQMEREVFKDLNNKLTFLNIDDHDLKDIKYQKIISSMQNNNIESSSFDYVLANATIHHSSKPHESILQMYRIATKGVLIIEGNDSILMRISNKFGLTETFERSAIENNQGGVDNTGIPNFIYRWTEREIYKLLNSYNPQIEHKVIFDYNFDISNIFKNNTFKKQIINILLKIFFFVFKSQQNLMSIYIDKKKIKKRFNYDL